jgi:hypothetical protein
VTDARTEKKSSPTGNLKSNKGNIMNICRWTVEGTLRNAPSITRKGRRRYATLHLEVTGGEVVVFAQDDSVINEVARLKQQDLVRLTGVIEPRDPEKASKQPYFLNALFVEPLNKSD